MTPKNSRRKTEGRFRPSQGSAKLLCLPPVVQRSVRHPRHAEGNGGLGPRPRRDATRRVGCKRRKGGQQLAGSEFYGVAKLKTLAIVDVDHKILLETKSRPSNWRWRLLVV